MSKTYSIKRIKRKLYNKPKPKKFYNFILEDKKWINYKKELLGKCQLHFK